MRWLFALLVFVLTPFAAAAQPVWTQAAPLDGLTVEAHKPLYTDASGVTFLTSAWLLTGQATLRPGLRAGGEIGVSHYGQQAGEPGLLGTVADEVRETTLSNVALFLAYDGFFPNLTVTLQGRLPTASDRIDNVGSLAGRYADLHRYDAFLSHTSTVSLAGDYRVALDEIFSLRGRVGAVGQFTGERSTNAPARSDVVLRYAVQGWYEDADFRVGVGAVGISNLTDEFAGFVERSQVMLAAVVVAKAGGVEPGLAVKVPMTDELGTAMDAAVTLSLAVPLR
ncbi:MAG: hypothetical protein GVY15_10400 [Bacteroidetes bacterium]|jgi:hypothetical protein|nr:hypothetical protein [Bacteroidota bacterium]